MKSVVLVDQDMVLADFEQGFLNIWRKRYPNLPYILPQNRNTFYIADQYPKELKSAIEAIVGSKGFYRNHPPIIGSVQAILEMSDKVDEVFICTSPFIPYENCLNEKYEWIEEHLGKEWIHKTILTKDKTLIHGNYLIDDKPNITGVHNPTWEHIIYDQPYNRHITDKKRLTWKNWREVLIL